MNYDMSYNKIVTDENFMETMQHGSNSYPFRFYYENLALFDFHCIDWHWHTELEFVYVESGTVDFWIGERQFALSEGNGVFINSKILHRLYSSGEAVIPNFVCMPFFIADQNSLIYHKYVLPIVSADLPFLVFHGKISWQEEALSIIRRIIAVQDGSPPCELAVSSLVQSLWLKIYENVNLTCLQFPVGESAASQARLQVMMQFIHQNYPQDISLDDIAVEVRVSKSTVLNLFRKYLHMTPINYLIHYRLNEAAMLLSKTEKKVNTISDETGFHNVDYFCRLFKKHYHMTPTEYRKKKAQTIL